MKITKRSPSSAIYTTIAEDNPASRVDSKGNIILSISTGKYRDIYYHVHINEKDIAIINNRKVEAEKKYPQEKESEDV